MKHHAWLLLLAAGCSGDPTYLVATITRGNVPATTPIRGLLTTIELDDREDMTPMLEPSAGAEFALPATLSLEVGSGDGVAIVEVDAYGDGAALLSSGSTELVVGRGEITPVTIELGRHVAIPPDGGMDTSDISITPASVDFGTRTIGTTPIQQFTVGNNGGLSMPLDVTLFGVGNVHFEIVTDNCNQSLDSGEICTVDVSFKPTIVDAVNATIGVRPYESAASAGLEGAGVLFSLTPSALPFGNVSTTSSVVQTVTITNESQTDATEAITWQITGDADFEVETATSSCTGAPLPPRATCTLDVRFTPASAGMKSASLDVTDRETMSLPLTGTGM